MGGGRSSRPGLGRDFAGRPCHGAVPTDDHGGTPGTRQSDRSAGGRGAAGSFSWWGATEGHGGRPRIAWGADRLTARLSRSCCSGELGRRLAPDLNDLAAAKFLAALLLAPPRELLPIAVDLDAPQQQHRLGPFLNPPHPAVVQSLAHHVPRRPLHHPRGDY